MADNEHRKSLNAKQPGIEYGPEGNGWPEPLTDPSDPIRYEKTEGKSGKVESKRVEDCKTESH